MVTREDYQIAYIFYTEGQIFEATNASLSLRAMTESVEIIQEDMKINIRKYINMIIEKIQKVWDRFKENVANNKFKWKDDQVTNAIKNHEPSITIDNYISYNTDFYKNIDIKELNYSTMSEHLDQESDFLKTYYSNFYTDSSKSVKENMSAFSRQSKTEQYRITKDDITNMNAYRTGYNAVTEKFTQDIQDLNKSASNADFIANQLNTSSTPTTTTSATTNNPTQVNASYMFIREADEPENQIKSSDAPGGSEEKKKEQEAADDARRQGEKRIQNYFRYTTSIFSAEMEISREIYRFYLRVLTKFMKDCDKADSNAKKEAESEKRVEKTDDNGTKINQVQA